jgi:hypothetical protein
MEKKEKKKGKKWNNVSTLPGESEHRKAQGASGKGRGARHKRQENK